MVIQDVPEAKERGKTAYNRYNPDKEQQKVSQKQDHFGKKGQELFAFILDLNSGFRSSFEAPYHAEYKKPNSDMRLPALKCLNGILKSNGDEKL